MRRTTEFLFGCACIGVTFAALDYMGKNHREQMKERRQLNAVRMGVKDAVLYAVLDAPDQEEDAEQPEDDNPQT